jgi:hypothetical protein
MPQPFDALRERLLRAGFAPRQVRRYCRELADHLADLTSEARAAGADGKDAEALARARLGSDEALAAALLARPSLRSWTARAPWAALALTPVAVLTLAYVIPILALSWWIGPYPAGMPDATQGLIRSICAFDAFTLPWITACVVAVVAARQRLPLVWPLLGLAVVADVGAAFRAHVLWPGHVALHPSDWSIGFSVVANPTAHRFLGRFHETSLLSLAAGLIIYGAARLGAGRASGLSNRRTSGSAHEYTT